MCDADRLSGLPTELQGRILGFLCDPDDLVAVYAVGKWFRALVDAAFRRWLHGRPMEYVGDVTSSVFFFARRCECECLRFSSLCASIV